MKTHLTMVAACGMIILAHPAKADPGNTSLGYISNVTFRDVGVDFTVDGATNPMNCAVPIRFRIDPSIANYSTIVSGMVTAFSIRKQVSVFVYQSTSDAVGLIAAVSVNQ